MAKHLIEDACARLDWPTLLAITLSRYRNGRPSQVCSEVSELISRCCPSMGGAALEVALHMSRRLGPGTPVVLSVTVGHGVGRQCGTCYARDVRDAVTAVASRWARARAMCVAPAREAGAHLVINFNVQGDNQGVIDVEATDVLRSMISPDLRASISDVALFCGAGRVHVGERLVRAPPSSPMDIVSLGGVTVSAEVPGVRVRHHGCCDRDERAKT